MRIEQLKYLVAAADCGSFTAASAALYVAQPSISQSVSALEKELCVTLLNRTKSGVEPTEIGREIISHARSILSEIDNITLIAKNELGNATAVIVAAPIASSTVLPILMEGQDSETLKRIEVIDAATDQAEQMIERGEADLAIVPYIDPGNIDKTYGFTPLFEAQCMAAVNPDSPLSADGTISFEEIQKHPIAIFSKEYISYDIVMNRIGKYGKPDVVLKTLIPRPLLIKSVISNAECIGISFDVGLFNNQFIKTGELLPLYIDGTVILTFGLLYRKDRPLSPLMTALKVQIEEAAAKFAKELAAFHRGVSERRSAR